MEGVPVDSSVWPAVAPDGTSNDQDSAPSPIQAAPESSSNDPFNAVSSATTAPEQEDDAAEGETTIMPTDPASELPEASTTSATEGTADPTDSASSSSPSLTSAPSLASAIPSSTHTEPANALSMANKDDGGGGPHFHITYLIPLFVILGLLLLLAVGGKVWGRVAFAKERAQKRQERRRREAQLLANKQRNAYVQPWSQEEREKGWAQFNDVDASMEMQRQNHEFDAVSDCGDDADEKTYGYGHAPGMSTSPIKLTNKQEREQEQEQHGVQLYDGPVPYEDQSDGDVSEHELRGPLSALGTHLAGQKFGQRAPPPPARMETQRFGMQVAANSWWSVQWNRYAGVGGRSGSYDNLQNDPAASWVADQQTFASIPGVTSSSTSPGKRREGTKQGFMSRLKKNIGWGYDGTSPALNVENRMHATVMPPQPPLLWSRLPAQDDHDLDAEQHKLRRVDHDDDDPFIMPKAPFALSDARGGRSAFDRSLPPTPHSPATPLARKRTQTTQAFALSRSHTQLAKPILSLSRMGSTDPVTRSSTVAVRRKPVMLDSSDSGTEEDEKEQEEMVKAPRRFKSMSSVAASSSAMRSETGSSKLQRQITFAAPRSSKPQSVTKGNPSGSRSIPSKSQLVRKATTKAIFTKQPMRQPVNFGDEEEEEDDDDGAGGRGDELVGMSAALPALDSFKLTRSRSAKRPEGDAASIMTDTAAMTPGTMNGEVILDLLHQYSSGSSTGSASPIDQISPVPELSRPASSTGGGSSASSSGQDEEEEVAGHRLPDDFAVAGFDDLETEIDSVLLSVIARSNTSKSYARGFHSVSNSPAQKALARSPSKPSTPSTPLGRTGTWRKENGKWTRSSPPPDGNGNAGRTPNATAQYTPTRMNGVSPLPLPTPSLATMPRALLAGSPERRTLALDDRSSFASSSSSPSRTSSTATKDSLPQVISRQRSTLLRQPATSTNRAGLVRNDGNGDGLSQSRRPEREQNKLGTSHAHIGQDFFFTSQHDIPSAVAAAAEAQARERQRRGTSASSHTVSSLESSVSSSAASASNSAQRSDSSHSSVHTKNSSGSSKPSSGVSKSAPTGPSRRAALAKRSSPQRYTAKLAGGEEQVEDEDVENTQLNSAARLHTGKSIRTPAEKRREQQYAMDRVQSLVSRAHAARLNQPEPEHWMAES